MALIATAGLTRHLGRRARWLLSLAPGWRGWCGRRADGADGADRDRRADVAAGL